MIDVFIVILLIIYYITLKAGLVYFLTSLFCVLLCFIGIIIKADGFCLDIPFAILMLSIKLCVISLICSVIVIILNSKITIILD